MLSFTVYPTPVSKTRNPSKQTTKSFNGGFPSDTGSNSVLPSSGGAGVGPLVRTISATSPFPVSSIIAYPLVNVSSQLSTKDTNGGLVYPDPRLIRSTPIVLPALSTTASATAPIPPPPKISILGGPHLNALTSHLVILDGIVPAESPSGSLNISKSSINFVASSIISPSDGMSKNPAKSSICA